MATNHTSDSALDGLDDITTAAVSSVPDAVLSEGADPAPPTADAELDAAMSAVDFAQMTDEQLDSLGSGDQERIAKALNLEVAPTRISLRSVTDPEERRAVAEATRLLRDGKHSTLRDALIDVLGLQAADTAEPEGAHEEPPAEGEPEAPAVEAISALENDLEHAQAYFDYEKVMALQSQIANLRSDQRVQQQVETQHAVQLQGWVAEEEDSRDAILAAYPDLEDPDSEFSNLIEDEIIVANSRQPDIFLLPDWPEKIAFRVNEKHGGRFGGGTVEPGLSGASRAIPNPPPRPGVRMPGSPVGPGANTSALTAHTALAAFDKLSLEEQDAVLTQLDIAHQRRGRGTP